MLRTALLFFFLLGFISSELHAAPAATAARPIHRHKPMAGNYRPVYKTYRNHSSSRNGVFRLFKRRPVARHRVAHAHKARAHRGTL